MLLFGLSGCDSGRTASVDSSPAGPLSSVEPTRSGESVKGESVKGESVKVAITDQDAEKFAGRWLRAVIDKDIAVVQKLVDWDGIMDRTLQGIDVNDEFCREFIQDETSPESTERLIGTIADEVNAGGSYRLVRVTERGGRSHVMLRLLNAEGALNYHDLRLKRAGDLIVADRLLFASSGESFSDTMRCMVAVAVIGQSSLVSRLSDDVQRELRRLKQQAEMVNALRRGDNETALMMYENMPAELRQMRMPMLLRIMASDVGGDEAYLKAIDEFVAKHPSDSVVGMITLDAAIFRENHELLMRSHQQLTRFTGGDPYLDLMVGGVLANHGYLTEAKEMTDSIDPSNLGLASAHDFKLSVAMADEDHPTTLRQLVALRDNFGFELSDLNGVEGFEKFVAVARVRAMGSVHRKAPGFRVIQALALDAKKIPI